MHNYLLWFETTLAIHCMTLMICINCPITPAVPACLSDPVRLTKGSASVPVSHGPAKNPHRRAPATRHKGHLWATIHHAGTDGHTIRTSLLLKHKAIEKCVCGKKCAETAY